MYTIISGTNRADSHTEKISKEYKRILFGKKIDAQIFTLKGVDFLKKNPAFSKLEKEIIYPSEKFIFIIPEYNGSYPGSLKAMIDISDIKNCWWWKKALLTGVSTGRAGNLRGMDHLTATLQHMNMFVHPNKLPISVVDTVMNVKGDITSDGTLQAINKQLDEFITF